MMAAEYYQIKSIAWVFRAVNAIPVERSGRDSAALRAALRVLEKGAVLGIFPEGRISLTHEVLPFQTGVALMAIRTGVPVYPAYLEGTQRGKEMVPAFLIRNRVTLRFGPAVEFDRTSNSRQVIDDATQRIRNAVISLKDNGL
jgi:1-acyl-sn-glycerol-3-phosphate acyltransferase